jgi:hypothetical protein
MEIPILDMLDVDTQEDVVQTEFFMEITCPDPAFIYEAEGFVLKST